MRSDIFVGLLGSLDMGRTLVLGMPYRTLELTVYERPRVYLRIDYTGMYFSIPTSILHQR